LRAEIDFNDFHCHELTNRCIEALKESSSGGNLSRSNQPFNRLRETGILMPYPSKLSVPARWRKMKTRTHRFFYCLIALSILMFLPIFPPGYCHPSKEKIGCPLVYNLTVINVPSAGGNVSGTGINCGNGARECRQSYNSVTQVQLTATPGDGWIFDGWIVSDGPFKLIDLNNVIDVNLSYNMILIARWISEQPTIQVNLVPSPQNNIYVIDATPTMPSIGATAEIVGLSPDPTSTTTFTWTADLGIGIGNGTIVSLDQYIVQNSSTTGNQIFNLGLVDPIEVLGGNLVIKASATVNGALLEGQSPPLAINGANPETSDVQNAIDAGVLNYSFCGNSGDYQDALKRVACKESGQRQFDGSPNGGIGPALVRFDGGVGIFQIVSAGTATQPYDPFQDPTVIFNWKANVNEGIAVFQEKNGMALYYPGQLRGSSAYQDFIENNINRRRMAKGLAPLPSAPAPDFSTTGLVGSLPPDQLLEDSVRGYNGYWGPQRFGLPLHEFLPDEAFLLTVPDSELQDLPSSPNVWRRVPAIERGSEDGDPNYVEDVIDQSPLCNGQPYKRGNR
jgi:hypothetical protein